MKSNGQWSILHVLSSFFLSLEHFFATNKFLTFPHILSFCMIRKKSLQKTIVRNYLCYEILKKFEKGIASSDLSTEVRKKSVLVKKYGLVDVCNGRERILWWANQKWIFIYLQTLSPSLHRSLCHSLSHSLSLFLSFFVSLFLSLSLCIQQTFSAFECM